MRGGIAITRFTIGAWHWASPVSSAHLCSWSCWGGQVRCRCHRAGVVWSRGERPRGWSGRSLTTPLRPSCPTTSCSTWNTRVAGVAEAPSSRHATTGSRLCHPPARVFPFYPRDVVSAVYATATWLGGWLAGYHTTVLYQNG